MPALNSGRIFKSGFINYRKNGMWALGTDQLLLKDNSMFKDKVLAPLHRNRKKKKTSEEERDKYITKLLLVPTKEGTYIPTIEYDTLCIAKTNSAPQIILRDNTFLSVTSHEGYRMARSSFPCVYGEWYYEIEVLEPSKIDHSQQQQQQLLQQQQQQQQNSPSHSYQSQAQYYQQLQQQYQLQQQQLQQKQQQQEQKPYACRLGWSSPKGDCQANVGYDYFSYSYRSTQGDIFHNARSKPYGETYKQGDVIGFYINLPLEEDDINKEKIKEFPNINQLDIYEMISNDLSLPSDQPLTPLKGSFIQFFKNGLSPGPAFTNIGKSFYYPAASLYMGATVKFNFGPDFKYPPPSHLNPKPFCLINNNNNK
ncbi:hypothetical protein ACTFIT_002229 [Dictyostelium discoideum]